MRKIIMSTLLALSLFVAGSTEVVAQTSTAPSATQADEIPAGKAALLKRLDRAMDFDGMMKSMYAGMMPMMTQALRQSNPKITEQQGADLSEVVTSVLAKYTPRMKDEMFKTYAKVFTESELSSMADFYESPNGQSVLKKMPLLMQEYTPVVSKMMPDMMKDMQKGLCDKGMCGQDAAPGKS